MGKKKREVAASAEIEQSTPTSSDIVVRLKLESGNQDCPHDIRELMKDAVDAIKNLLERVRFLEKAEGTRQRRLPASATPSLGYNWFTADGMPASNPICVAHGNDDMTFTMHGQRVVMNSLLVGDFKNPRFLPINPPSLDEMVVPSMEDN